MDQETKDLISGEIENNEVCLFMKGTPDAPQCGFSMAVSNMLKILNVNFKGINVLENQNLREGIKKYSECPVCFEITSTRIRNCIHLLCVKCYYKMVDMQENINEPLYIDAFHYTAPMSKMIANYITDALISRKLLK